MADDPLEILRIATSPTRLQILKLLRQGFDHPEDLAKKMKIRRQAVDKQLSELFDWGLVDRSAVFAPRATGVASSFELVPPPSLVTGLLRWIPRTPRGVGSASYGGAPRPPGTTAILIAASMSASCVPPVVPASSTISVGRPSRASAFRIRFRFVRSPWPIRTLRRGDGNVTRAWRRIPATPSGDGAWYVART